MKKTLEIECPDGYKPIYNAETGKVEIILENFLERVKTYKDVCDILQANKINRSVDALHKLQNIIDVLNEGYRFDLLKGTVWYPWVRFYRSNAVPNDAKVIGEFYYKDERFTLVGGCANTGSFAGLGSFYSLHDVGYADSFVGMLACKNKEIARYVSTQFGKLVFNACFTRHFQDGEFEWIG